MTNPITIEPNNSENPITVNLIAIEQDGNNITCNWECNGKESDTLIFSPKDDTHKAFHLIFKYNDQLVDSCCLKSSLLNSALMDPSPTVAQSWPPKNTNNFTKLSGGCLAIISGENENDNKLAFGIEDLILDPKIKVGGGTIPN